VVNEALDEEGTRSLREVLDFKYANEKMNYIELKFCDPPQVGFILKYYLSFKYGEG
jgi:hypothetical protein